jgi:uncharacterized protein YukE
MKDLIAIMNPTRWAVLAGVVVVLLGVASGAVLTAHSKGVVSGQAEIRAEWLAADNTALRESQREVSRLSGIVNNLNEVYREQIETIGRMADTLRAGGLRVSKAERDAAIAAGTAEAVRGYASTAADTFAACRSEYVSLGQGYAGCSATAQSLSRYADEVSDRPSRPTPPTPPTRP